MSRFAHLPKPTPAQIAEAMIGRYINVSEVACFVIDTLDGETIRPVVSTKCLHCGFDWGTNIGEADIGRAHGDSGWGYEVMCPYTDYHQTANGCEPRALFEHNEPDPDDYDEDEPFVQHTTRKGHHAMKSAERIEREHRGRKKAPKYGRRKARH